MERLTFEFIRRLSCAAHTKVWSTCIVRHYTLESSSAGSSCTSKCKIVDFSAARAIFQDTSSINALYISLIFTK